MFIVISKMKKQELVGYAITNTTKHFDEERINRFNSYSFGSKVLGAFEVDKNHRDGNEVHIIDDEGFIYIFNKNSKRFITILSGRPAQIKRYWEGLNMQYGTKVLQATYVANNRNKRTNANRI